MSWYFRRETDPDDKRWLTSQLITMSLRRHRTIDLKTEQVGTTWETKVNWSAIGESDVKTTWRFAAALNVAAQHAHMLNSLKSDELVERYAAALVSEVAVDPENETWRTAPVVTEES